tara:strand:+ start:522 stop:848 length:327 start_codon:yes stop_codon:yes gene_type:complete
MKIFYSVEELIKFINKNDELYYSNSNEVREVINKNGNGFYCLDFGSRGEVDFSYVENFVEDLIEWNSVSEDENEFRYMRDDIGSDYLDLNFEEECIRCYFLVIVGGKK